MSRPYTTACPRYKVEGLNGEHFDVFNKRENAIKCATKLAVEYPGNTFIVIKNVFRKDKIIFSFKIDCISELRDIQHIYRGLVETYQKKLDKTKLWRNIG